MIIEEENMILQSFVFPKKDCPNTEIYYRFSGECIQMQDYIKIEPGGELTGDTYMNMFDMDTWTKYTTLSCIELELTLEGRGVIELYHCRKEKEKVTETRKFELQEKGKISFALTYRESGMYYFKLRAYGEVRLHTAVYILHEAETVGEVRLALVICTYKREKQLAENLDVLKKSLFFQNTSPLYGKLFIRIVDNASEIHAMCGKYLRIYNNRNTGGSGGFTRGIGETVKEMEEFPATHVILMDDDVAFIPESFYRLYALLSIMRKECRTKAVAGRMFRMDQRAVQYTACEVWNSGDIRHIGENADMSLKENIIGMNDKTGEYSGWWFACFPIEYVRENRPLPFFLHCDDVEYGLRQGRSPIILNGIQVWHETFEYRQSAVITYYDTRNRLIVNALYGGQPDADRVLCEWKREISDSHVNGNYKKERMQILAMRDFCRGGIWFERADGEKYHNKLEKKCRLIRLKNMLLWRMVYMWTAVRYPKITDSYKKMSQRVRKWGTR